MKIEGGILNSQFSCGCISKDLDAFDLCFAILFFTRVPGPGHRYGRGNVSLPDGD